MSCERQQHSSEDIVTGVLELEARLEYQSSAELGEGAFWNHRTRVLMWVDILGHTLHHYNPKTKSNTSYVMPSLIGTVVPEDDSSSVVALQDGVYRFDSRNRELNLLAPVESQHPRTRLNDGKCDPNGHLWVGSMDMEERDPIASLYKIAPDGACEKMMTGITISNGIVWSKDGKTMYYIDTPTGTIRAYDFDTNTGTVGEERIVVAIPDSLGFPDGMAIDEEDKLWVGMWNGGAVLRFDPITGRVMSRIDVAAHNVTSCAFGGSNLDTLYITTASVDMTEEEKVKYPLAGSIFRCHTGVKGVRSSFFGRG